MAEVRNNERTVVLDRPALSALRCEAGGGPRFASEVLEVPEGFHRAAPSWNVYSGEGRGFVVQMRVGRAGGWSPYLLVGRQGCSAAGSARFRAEGFGEVEVDEFVGAGERLERLQLGVTFFGGGAEAGERVRRLAVAFDAPGERGGPSDDPVPPKRIEVPFRSQFEGTGKLGLRLCSPACLSMVLAYYGIDRPGLPELARVCYDPGHDLYGNWSRAVQAAFEYGLPGYLKRFGCWAEVVPLLERDRPVIASLRFGDGELPGSSVPQTRGHLVVVTGGTGRGEVWVNDPAFRQAGDGVRRYPGGALARAWFEGSGMGYVLGE